MKNIFAFFDNCRNHKTYLVITGSRHEWRCGVHVVASSTSRGLVCPALISRSSHYLQDSEAGTQHSRLCHAIYTIGELSNTGTTL